MKEYQLEVVEMASTYGYLKGSELVYTCLTQVYTQVLTLLAEMQTSMLLGAQDSRKHMSVLGSQGMRHLTEHS